VWKPSGQVAAAYILTFSSVAYGLYSAFLVDLLDFSNLKMRSAAKLRTQYPRHSLETNLISKSRKQQAKDESDKIAIDVPQTSTSHI